MKNLLFQQNFFFIYYQIYFHRVFFNSPVFCTRDTEIIPESLRKYRKSRNKLKYFGNRSSLPDGNSLNVVITRNSSQCIVIINV